MTVSSGRGRTPDVSDLRRKILDASVALVAEQGVRAVSFREVARRAGVSHQAPYHHFGDHHGILRAIAAEGFEGLASAMSDAAAAHDDPLHALEAAGVAYVRFARDHAGHFRVMFQRALVDLHDAEAPIPEAERTHATLVRLARAAHRAGHGAGLSETALTYLAWSAVHGLAFLLIEGTLGSKAVRTKKQEAALVEQVVGAITTLLGADRRR